MATTRLRLSSVWLAHSRASAGNSLAASVVTGWRDGVLPRPGASFNVRSIAARELGASSTWPLLNNLGALNDVQGRFQEAAALYRQPLTIRLKVRCQTTQVWLSPPGILAIRAQHVSPVASKPWS